MFVMNNENPDHSTSVALSSGTVKLMPSNRTLWRALFWAPAVAPLAFVALVLLVGIVGEYFGSEVNPASILVLPVIALTLGTVSCYFVAGVIGMPIAFYLRRIHSLNGYTIHGAAFCWAAIFASLCAVVMVGGSWNELPLALCYFGFGLIPPVLLSGTAFWLLLRQFSKSEGNTATNAGRFNLQREAEQSGEPEPPNTPVLKS
ncbi:MAG: hypothetical protein DWH80_10890 [Planctomycetota bacterium]|jgi:hypothetical protein|nr:MAG: hypothetical protein DWH80_10890 [Planctomycetota bacterium]